MSITMKRICIITMAAVLCCPLISLALEGSAGEVIKNSETCDKAGKLWKNYWVAWAVVPNPPSVGGSSMLNRAVARTDYKIG